MEDKESLSFSLNVTLAGMEEDDQGPETVAYAFDQTGEFLDSVPVEEESAKFSLPETMKNKTARILLGPRFPEEERPSISVLRRRNAHERRIRIDPEEPRLDLHLPDRVWRDWLLCACTVRGRLIKRQTEPDGTVRELPICHARVSICEVDRLPRLIWRLPDSAIFRLRDEVISSFGGAPMESPSIEPALDRPVPRRYRERDIPAGRLTELASAEAFDVEVPRSLRTLQQTDSSEELRSTLIDLSEFWRPFLCDWDWLDPYFYSYDVDCLETVEVDEEGRFETTILYPCDDQPDLYFEAEQLHGGSWETIYEPSVRCNTHWNYDCGSEVVLNVDDPSAEACVPEDPVEKPEEVSTWIMPYSIRQTKIWGSPSSGGSPPGDGWVKQNGFTDYGGFSDAPFGGTLTFRMSESRKIPNADIKYYRWSYRKGSSGNWIHMDRPVFRHYAKYSPSKPPGERLSFPTYQLGPDTINGEANLFEFKPDEPPSDSDARTYWPTDNFAGDIHSAFWNTQKLGPDAGAAAGTYQVRLEIFDEDGNKVNPGSGTFDFVVPKSGGSGRTIRTRTAEPAEINAGGFTFDVHIDNNQCTADIHAPRVSGDEADDCGFLRYSNVNDKATVAFEAEHPNDHAVFSFRIIRADDTLLNTKVSNVEVGAPEAKANPPSRIVWSGTKYGDGNGNFEASVPLNHLLWGPEDKGNKCTEAAFAERLSVRAKATNGGSRLQEYDSSDIRAFALAKEDSS